MASNASSYFLKIKSTKTGDVKGEATAKVAKDQIEVRSFEFLADRPFDLVNATAPGRITCRELQFVLPISRASAILLSMFFNNENISTAELTCYRADADGKEVQYLKWTFTDARILSYKVASEERFPYDTLHLAYAKADYTYPTFSLAASWYGAAPSTT